MSKKDVPFSVLKTILANNTVKNSTPRFAELTVIEMLSNAANQDDIRVLEYLVADKSTVSGYKYKASEIVEIMKSPEKKSQIISALDNNTTPKKSSVVRSERIKSQKIKTRPNENYIIKDYPASTPKETILRDVPAGEVAQIGGKLYANDGEGNLVEIKMRKETFERLFPQKDKFEMHQGRVGNCYLISAFNAAMQSPKGRISLYKLIEEKDGDIYVKYPESAITVKFNDGKPVWLSPAGIYKANGSISTFLGKSQVDGCDGIKILEQAYALQRNKYGKSGVLSANDIFFMTREMQRSDSGGSELALKDISGRNNVTEKYFYFNNLDYQKQKGESFDDLVKVLEENDPNTLLFIGVEIDKFNLGLMQGHAYNISSYNPETKTVGIINPWNTSKEIQIPLYELANIGSCVSAVKFNSSFANDYNPQSRTEVLTPRPDGAENVRMPAPSSDASAIGSKILSLRDVDGNSMFSERDINLIMNRYSPEEIKSLDRIFDLISETYSNDRFPDVRIGETFSSIVNSRYLRSTRDFKFFEDVLNFKSDPDVLYDIESDNLFADLLFDDVAAMKKLMEISKEGDNSLLQNIHNIRYIVDVMSSKGFDSFDIEAAFKMRNEKGEPVLNFAEFEMYDMSGWNKLNLPLSPQKLENLREVIQERFQGLSDEDLNNILKHVKDTASSRVLTQAMAVKNNKGEYIFDESKIMMFLDYSAKNPETRFFLDRLFSNLQGTTSTNLDAPLKEILSYVKDKESLYVVNEFMKVFQKKSDINWRAIGKVCYNINNSSNPAQLESAIIKAAKMFVENDNVLYTFTQVDSPEKVLLVDAMLEKSAKTRDLDDDEGVIQFTSLDMSQILGAYNRGLDAQMDAGELKDIMLTAIEKDVDPAVITTIPEFKQRGYNESVMNFILDAGAVKDNKNTYKFSQYGIDAIIEASGGDAGILNYVNNLVKDYPNITTKQIIDHISNKEITLPTSYKYPFSENGEFRDQYSRIIKSAIWKNLPNEKQGKLFFYFNELVNKDPNRFVRLVESGYFELASEGKVDINDLIDNIGTNKFFSKHYLEDVKRLSSGEPLVKELPSGTDLKTLTQSVPEGEVGYVDGKLYVNDNGSMVELKLNKETFERLFPLEGRFNTKQQSLGDCWLISAIDNLMDLPAGRAKIYQMFSQKGNDIFVTLPNKSHVYNPELQPDGSYALTKAELVDSPYIIKLTNGKIPDNGSKQVKACDGVKMLEFAYSIKRSGNQPSMSPYEFEELADVSKQMESLTGGLSREFIASILGYRSDINGNYFNVDGDMVGGVMPTSNGIDYSLAMIRATANDRNTLLYASTHNIPGEGPIEKRMSPAFDLYSNHAYTIKGYDEDSGLVYFTNPWNANTVVEMDVYTFLKYIANTNYLRL